MRKGREDGYIELSCSVVEHKVTVAQWSASRVALRTLRSSNPLFGIRNAECAKPVHLFLSPGEALFKDVKKNLFFLLLW